MIAKVGGAITAAVIVMMIGCSAVAGAILGYGGDDTATSSTSSCLSMLETSSPPSAASAPSGSAAPSAAPTDSDDPYGIDQCLSCLMDPTAAPPSPVPSDGPDCSADAVFARAATWLTAWNGGPVPYLSSNVTADLFGGYRRDCSGYVSMALGLPGPGLNTRDMAARFTPIDKADLQPGDLLINPAPDLKGHVVLFERWTDSSETSYIGYEQTGDGGTKHRQITYPYFHNYPMSPYAPINRT
jgi:hypothetical protein